MDDNKKPRSLEVNGTVYSPWFPRTPDRARLTKLEVVKTQGDELLDPIEISEQRPTQVEKDRATGSPSCD